MRSIRPTLAACIACSAWLAVGCERPPVGPVDDDPPAPGRVGPLGLEAFLQDRPAIGGKWYAYDPSGHTLEPKPEAWIVRDEVLAGAAGDTPARRHAAFRIVSVYETDRAASGRFTLELALHDGSNWREPQTWVAPRNIKDTGPLCVDLFAVGGAGDDVDCATDGWQLRLAMQNRFSTSAGIAVAEPALAVRSAAGTSGFGSVHVARLGETAALTALPDPQTLVVLDDGVPLSWASTDWSFEHLAPNLPRAGMAIGARFVDPGFVARPDVYWLVTGRLDVVRFTLAPLQDGAPEAGLRIRASLVRADLEDLSVPDAFPEDITVDIPSPAVGDAQWLSFAEPSLLASPEDVAGARWPHAPPRSPRWDLALVRPTDDTLALLVSPFACTLNATARGLDDELPPVASEK